MDPLFWLLLPVAAASGWWMAQRSARKKRDADRSGLRQDAYRGLNYLLNEQADKATEVLIRLVQVDRDTVELHLALGSLFRRRGEIDRAIQMHQYLVDRPELSDGQRAQAKLELGRDYLGAGLLDRAEQLFGELLDQSRCRQAAAQHLIDLYQQGNEWEKAIRSAAYLQADATLERKLAHYCCELAQAALDEARLAVAEQWLGRAREHDPNSARVLVLEGRCRQRAGRCREALDTWRRLEERDAAALPLVFDDIARCYAALGQAQEAGGYFRTLAERQPALAPLTPLESAPETRGAGVPVGERQDGRVEVSLPRVLQWVKQTRAGAGDADQALSQIEAELQHMIRQQPGYRCGHCGFAGRKLFWQCPGCRHWDSMKLIALQEPA